MGGQQEGIVRQIHPVQAWAIFHLIASNITPKQATGNVSAPSALLPPAARWHSLFAAAAEQNEIYCELPPSCLSMYWCRRRRYLLFILKPQDRGGKKYVHDREECVKIGGGQRGAAAV